MTVILLLILTFLGIVDSIYLRNLVSSKSVNDQSKSSASNTNRSNNKQSVSNLIKTTSSVAAIATTSISNDIKASSSNSGIDAKKLPWQVKIFDSMLGWSKRSQSSNNGNIDKGAISSTTGTSRTDRMHAFLSSSIEKAYSFLSKPFLQKFSTWIVKHKGLFVVTCKAAVFSFVGLLILRKISHWYKRMAEFELLLDRTDHEYQAYGYILNDIGTLLISSIDQNMVNEYKYTYLYRKLVNALDTPCFPQIMMDYSVQTGRDVAILISELDMRLRGRRRRGGAINGISIDTAIGPLASLESNIITPLTSSVPIDNHNETVATTATGATSSFIHPEETLVIHLLQRGVSVLLARQADASLRLARVQVLTAVNTCEDLVAIWKSKVESKSQALRLPVPRFILSHIPGFSNFRAATKQGLHRITTGRRSNPSDTNAAAAVPSQLAPNAMDTHTHGSNSTEALSGSVRNAISYQYYDHNSISNQTIASDSSISSSSSSSTSSSARLDNHINEMLRDLNAREKVVLLEEMLTSLYVTAGDIQKHLDALGGISKAVVDIELDKMHNSKRYDSSWAALDGWTAHASYMCSNSLSSILTQQVDSRISMRRSQEKSTHSKSRSRGRGRGGAGTSNSGNGNGNSSSNKMRQNSMAIDNEDKAIFLLALNDNSSKPLMSYSCSKDTLLSLCNFISINDTAEMQGSIKLREFAIPMRVGEVIEHCLVRSDAFASAVESTGDDVIASRPWEEMKAVESVTFNNLWTRELSYTHHYQNSWLTKPTAHTLVQVLNTNDMYYNNYTNNYQGSAALVGFMNLSGVPWCSGCSYTTRWVFESVAPSVASNTDKDSNSSWIDHNDTNITTIDYQLHTETKVTVTLDIKCPSSVYQSIIISRMTSDLKKFVEHWRICGVNILSDGLGFSQRQKELPHGEAELLEAIGRNSNTPDHSNRDKVDTSSPSSPSYYPSIKEKRYPYEQSSHASIQTLSTSIHQLRGQWRLSEIALRDIAKAPDKFTSHLVGIGLKKKSKKGLLGLLRLGRLIKLSFWSATLMGGVELAKRSNDIQGSAQVVATNFLNFIQRRITTPTLSIVEDVVFNRRVSLTDKEALVDSKRSLQAMLDDFLVQYRPKMSDTERGSFVSKMNMKPISEEYELELRRPIQNILSGRIARLVLIQLQFVKKELLVAMQAIDELFNANQVNLQLLAVTPAVLSILVLQYATRTVITALKSSSRGRFIESTAAVQRDLRSGVRECERLLSMSSSYHTDNSNMVPVELGRLMSILFRLHNILILNSSHFDDLTLRHLQEDLRDLTMNGLTINQRLAMIERVTRTYPFLQATRKLWGGYM